MTEKLNFEICFFFRLAVVLSVLLRFTDYGYPLCYLQTLTNMILDNSSY